jgi:hypothetical protein
MNTSRAGSCRDSSCSSGWRFAASSALVSINMWTGAPAFALWLGSRYAGWVGARAPGTGVTMEAIAVVVVLLLALELTLTAALTRLSAKWRSRLLSEFSDET